MCFFFIMIEMLGVFHFLLATGSDGQGSLSGPWKPLRGSACMVCLVRCFKEMTKMKQLKID